MEMTITDQLSALGELYTVAEAVPYCPIGDTHTVRGGGPRLHVRVGLLPGGDETSRGWSPALETGRSTRGASYE